MSMTTLFVYGTLMRGQINHDRFCCDALSIEEATVRGWLCVMPSGVPVLQVPDISVLSTGTRDISVDVDVQEQHAARLALRRHREPEDGELVHGELLTLDDPVRQLPPIDRLEGFHPGMPCLYRRVLVPAFVKGEVKPAWVYVAGSDEIIRSCRPLLDGKWEHG